MRSVVSILESVLGAESVFPGENLPDPWPNRLVGVFSDPGVSPDLVVPPTLEALEEVMVCATRQHWKVLPVGQGWQLSWGKPSPPVDLLLSTARLNQCIDHAVGDLTLTAQAGMTLHQIRSLLRPHRQMVPLQGTCGGESTLGGLVATADSGSLRHRYGGVRDLLLGIEFVRADGQRSKAGGRVVKNVAGYDLMKLLTGSYGSLGIITQVTFRCYPIPDRKATLLLWGDPSNVQTVFETLQASALTPVAVDLLSSQLLQDSLKTKRVTNTSGGSPVALAVQFASLEAAVSAQLTPMQEWAKTHHLDSIVLEDREQTQFWQEIQCRGHSYFSSPGNASGGRETQRIFCKIGILPSAAIDFLTQLNTLNSPARGLIHGGSGLGWLELEPYNLRFPILQSLRHQCQGRQGQGSQGQGSQSGFLTLLEGPVSLKQQMDVWGYGGNALGVMQRLKQTFDPQNLLSPQRFVGG